MALTGILGRLLSAPSLGRSIAVMMSGTAAAHGLAVLASPLITRLYSPSDFATWAAYASLFILLLPFVSWRYDVAIPVVKHREDAANQLALSLAVTVVMCLTTVLVVALFAKVISGWINIPRFSAYLWFLPFSLLAAGIYSALSGMFIRQKRFVTVAGADATQGFASLCVRLLFGALRICPLGFFWGDLAGRTASASVLWLKSFPKRKRFAGVISWGSMLDAARATWRYPVFLVPAMVFNIAAVRINALLLPAYFGVETAGQYAMASCIIAAPSAVFITAYSKVLAQRAAERKNSGLGLYAPVCRMYWKLFSLAVGPAIIAFWLAPWIVPVLFGSRWAAAGQFIRILVPWLAIRFIVAPSHILLPVYDKHNLFLLLGSVVLAFRVLAVLVGAHVFQSATFCIVLWSLVSCLGNIAFAAVILAVLKRSETGRSEACLT